MAARPCTSHQLGLVAGLYLPVSQSVHTPALSLPQPVRYLPAVHCGEEEEEVLVALVEEEEEDWEEEGEEEQEAGEVVEEVVEEAVVGVEVLTAVVIGLQREVRRARFRA